MDARLPAVPVALPVALLVAAALLAGCGGSDSPVAKDPAPSTGAASTGLPPHWPSTGCDTRSTSQIDYAMDAPGSRTRQEALARYVPDGASVIQEPRHPHREARWLVVDENNVIIRAVSVIQGGHGWLVDSVEQCSG